MIIISISIIFRHLQCLDNSRRLQQRNDPSSREKKGGFFFQHSVLVGDFLHLWRQLETQVELDPSIVGHWLVDSSDIHIMHICFEINGIPSDRDMVFSLEHQILRMTTPLFKTQIEPEDHLKLFKASPISVSFTVSQFHRKFQDFNQHFQSFFFRFWLFSSRFWSPYLSTSKRRPFRECRRMPKKVTSKPSHWRRLTGFPKNKVDIKMMAGVLALAITLVPTGERCLMVI